MAREGIFGYPTEICRPVIQLHPGPPLTPTPLFRCESCLRAGSSRFPGREGREGPGKAQGAHISHFLAAQKHDVWAHQQVGCRAEDG